MEVPCKLKIELPYDPANPLLGIYPKKMKTLILKDTCTPMFIAALFTIAKIWQKPKCPLTDEWIKKMWHMYTEEYYSAIKSLVLFKKNQLNALEIHPCASVHSIHPFSLWTAILRQRYSLVCGRIHSLQDIWVASSFCF